MARPILKIAVSTASHEERIATIMEQFRPKIEEVVRKMVERARAHDGTAETNRGGHR